MTIDLWRVQDLTHNAKESFDRWLVRAERAAGDEDRKTRLRRGQCLRCFYMTSTRIGGAAITTKPCDSCGIDMTFGSTYVNAICIPCSDRYGLCVECCADLELKRRTKLERKP